MKPPLLSRRALIGSASAALTAEMTTGTPSAATPPIRDATEAVPMTAVRLSPSPFHDAMLANGTYLMRLAPDRLLHNYRAQAGLAPKDAVYGGWESDTIAGHTLGHYLSALSLYHAQTGEAEARRRVAYIVSELVLCQRPDGYVAGFTRMRDGRIEPGRAAFDEVAAGHIHATGFDLNGAWSPLYNWHKLFAGLLDAHRLCGETASLDICSGLAAYIGNIFDRLDDAQVQRVLACEYGGLNESLGELSVRTGNARWLHLAERIHDDRTLDPLARGEDDLADLHANTQIPKVIGLARLHEITGRTDYASASQTFWSAVTKHHSYVIGGSGDREYFTAADSAARYVTEQTCETCASYNMLKLTRQLYARAPTATFFDYYERTHLNHILAQQNPRTGMFAYMTPLLSGSSRVYSSPFDDFWCCVGTGMESHAKHGDSIFWHTGPDTLLVNLFIAARLDWDGIGLSLATDYPSSGLVTLDVTATARSRPWALRLRVPGWSSATTARLNGQPVPASPDADGYLTLRRDWRPGDRVVLLLDMRLRLERSQGSGGVASVLRGPSVLAADLGPATEPFDDAMPALIGPRLEDEDILRHLQAAVDGSVSYRSTGLRPHDVRLTAFAQQHERRSAVYFPVLTEAEWITGQARSRSDRRRLEALAARAIDVLRPGDTGSERDHGLVSAASYPVTYRGRNGRDARSGGFLAFRLRAAPSALQLVATYWGEERDSRFRILVDGSEVAVEHLDASHPGIFFDRTHIISPRAGRDSILVRLEPLPDHSAGPLYAAYCLATDRGLIENTGKTL